MRTIRGLLEIIGFLVIVVAGYWVWYTTWAPNPKDQIGVTIAPMLPSALRDWGCGKLNARFGTEAPTVCSPVADQTSPPSTTTPATPESGKL